MLEEGVILVEQGCVKIDPCLLISNKDHVLKAVYIYGVGTLLVSAVLVEIDA